MIDDDRMIGISMERAPMMARSLDAGRPVDVDEEPTLADSLRGGIGLDNRHTFRIVRDAIDEVVLVTESQIWAAMRFCFDELRLVVEGAAAVGVAAVMSGRVTLTGPTVVVISGANAETDHIADLATGAASPR
jgi:threonine dehydratase